MDKEKIQTQDEPIVALGDLLLSWNVHEYPRHSRSKYWYTVSAIVGLALIIYAVVTANFLFAVIILMIGIITLISTFQEPDEIDIALTTTGIVIGNTFYSYPAIKDFSIAYQPPEVKILYLDFVKPWQPVLSVPLSDIDPNHVRESLMPFCIENLERDQERLYDLITRLYKF